MPETTYCLECGAALPVNWPKRPVLPFRSAHIGRYKLLEQIGEGGFGVVWMAEQEEPARRRVALKIIKPGAFECKKQSVESGEK